MRLHAALTLVCYLIVSEPAFAATEKQIDRCTIAENPSDRVVACTEIINDKKELRQMRSLALSSRGSAFARYG